MRGARIGGVLGALLVLGTAGAVEAQHAYVGSDNCRKCHIKQYRSWEATTMAQTFETLRPGVAAEAKVAANLDPAADYTADPQCVGCHVTGWGRPGGFVSEEETPELVGVGCEMCHGPGGTYTLEEHMSLKNKEYVKSELVAVGLVDQVGEEQCVACHNSDNPLVADDFVFDYEAIAGEGIHEHFELKYEH
jgi:hypothetical protein